MAKIYLSPAAHEHDRKCAYDSACSENTHCNLYIDQMIPYLDACGIEWKRSDKANTGDRYDITIAESNAFAPDIHYVAHTNAFNGTVKGSRLHVYWSDEKSREWGQKVLDWRKKIYPYPVALKDGSGLGEVKRPRPCVCTRSWYSTTTWRMPNGCTNICGKWRSTPSGPSATSSVWRL